LAILFEDLLAKRQSCLVIFNSIIIAVRRQTLTSLWHLARPQISQWKEKTNYLISDFRLVELLLSVSGDTLNANGPRATKGIMDGLSVALSLSATAYLESWQTLSLMIRSTGAGVFDVVTGSTFSVVLLGKTMTFCQ